MRTKNKMKDFEAKFEEWWKVAKEYFTKELEKNLAQHTADERILRYMLEAYQKNFPDFICGNPTSTKVLGQDEETKTGPSGIAQEEEVQTEESQDLRSQTVHEEEVQPQIPHDLRRRGKEEKEPKGIQEQEKVEAILKP